MVKINYKKVIKYIKQIQFNKFKLNNQISNFKKIRINRMKFRMKFRKKDKKKIILSIII